ncbi:MAG TPA: hypothetical protein VH590_18735, partial [Ktedonobacterales bacterium]
ARFWAQNERAMFTTIFSSSSLLSVILAGMLFAWLCVSAALTFSAGSKRPGVNASASDRTPLAPTRAAPQRRAEAPPEPVAPPTTASVAATDELPRPPAEAAAPFPLTRGRRAEQHVGPETASIAASVDSR